MKPTRDNFFQFLDWLFYQRGAEAYLGEPVTIADHMLQAAYCAEADGADEPLIVAALLHDVGHFTGAFGDDYIEKRIDNRHEEVGCAVLSPLFPRAVAESIGLHVAAKKYLCATDAAYYDTLSDASKKTLQLQGGVMNDDEVRAFENRRYFAAAVKLRRWDDAAKVRGLRVNGLPHYRAMIARTLIAA